MLRSVYVRFILVNVLVVILSVASTAALAGRMTTSEYGRFVARGDLAHYQRLVQMLSNSYVKAGSWEGIQGTIDGMGQIGGERVVVTDSGGAVLADSDKDLAGDTISIEHLPPAAKIFANGAAVGYLLINPGPNRLASAVAAAEGTASTGAVTQPAEASSAGPASRQSEANAAFPDAINRLTLLSAAIAAAISIILTLILTRRILRPVVALTAAAHRMESGDLSIRVKPESNDEIGSLAHAFNSLADSLARNEQLRQNMVNDVAHELRTPLTNLRGYLEAAREGMVKPDRQYIDSLYEETMLLNRLTDDLRELSLAEAGQLRLVMEPVSMGDVALAALDASRPSAVERGVTLRNETAREIPLVTADWARVGQALRNLLNNALDFTPAGGEVMVTVHRVDNEVRVEVHDTGPGIAPEHLPFIFERFYRADPSRTRSTGGAGLGLTIVKDLIEAQGGRVWVESSLGAGSTFGFSLPAQGAA